MKNLFFIFALLFGINSLAEGTGLFPIAGFQMGLPFADLQPFAETIKNARLVGLGESVHTSRGYYEAKRRLIQFLVEEQGFRLVLMETPMLTAFGAAEYVSHCTGTPEGATKSVFAVFQDIATRDMLKSLCEFNQSHPNDKVSFFGFDMQEPQELTYVLNLLSQKHLDPDGSIANGLNLCLVKASHSQPPPRDKIESNHRTCLQNIAVASDRVQTIMPALSRWQRFLLERSLYGSRTYEDELYYELLGDTARSFSIRDEAMASNISALNDYSGGKLKIVVWAHNGHVQKIPYSVPDKVKSMGNWLKEIFGDNYAPFSITAYHVLINWYWYPNIKYSQYPVIPDSIESILHGLGYQFAFLDTHGSWLTPSTSYYFRDGDFEVPSAAFRGVFYLDDSPGNIYIPHASGGKLGPATPQPRFHSFLRPSLSPSSLSTPSRENQ